MMSSVHGPVYDVDVRIRLNFLSIGIHVLEGLEKLSIINCGNARRTLNWEMGVGIKSHWRRKALE